MEDAIDYDERPPQPADEDDPREPDPEMLAVDRRRRDDDLSEREGIRG